MVDINYKVYPFAEITPQILEKYASGLRALEEKTSTKIMYDFKLKCFTIDGLSHENCTEAETIICESLLPRLNANIVPGYIEGVFSAPQLDQHVPASTEEAPAVERALVVARPASSDSEAYENENLTDEDDGTYEEGVNGKDENEPLVSKIFKISSTIHPVSRFIKGPVQKNMQSIHHLKEISKLFDVECTLHGRDIQIVGNENRVEEAYSAFSRIQKTVIGQTKTILVPCIHYPGKSREYGLYFCNLNEYRYNSMVHTHLNPNEANNMHVVLPVFIDSAKNEYARPVDMVYREKRPVIEQQQEQKQPAYSQIETSQEQPYLTYQQIQANQQKQLEEQYRQKQQKQQQQQIQRQQQQHQKQPQPQPQQPQLTYYQTEAIQQKQQQEKLQKLNDTMEQIAKANSQSDQRYWGEDRDFVNLYDDGSLEYLPKERLAEAFTPIPQEQLENSVSPVYLGDFPSLPTPTHTLKPKKQQPEEMRRRVLRIVPQKAASASLLERVKEYNYQNMKRALTTGLEAVQAFKGEVRLSARLGKTLWLVQSSDVNTKIWNFEDIADIVVRELGTIPRFSTMTTTDQNILECITSSNVIPQSSYNKTAIFEFHCSARNQPSLPYKPTIIHMNQGVVDLRKIVISEKSVVEIDWVNLDRKFDFQLSLTTKELLRRDVKPFTTFIKWISICPITQLMTFENVPNFLNVNTVLFKQTTRIRVVFPFVVEIVRVEKVPLKPVPNSNKITAVVGNGEFWYDFQVFNILHDEDFKSNLDLEVGEVADWTVDSILSAGSSDTITEYVKYMLTIVEKIEITARQMQIIQKQ